MKRGILIFVAVMMCLCVGFASAGCSPSKETLNLFNWGMYIDESLLTEFEEQTGIRVVMSVFTSNEEMYAKIKAGASNYDVLIPSDYMIQRMANEDMLAELDKSKLPSFQYILPEFADPSFDPGCKYSMPYMWGTFGIVYNTKEVSEPIDSWDVFWDPQYSGKMCIYDDIRDVFAIPLARRGYDINTTNQAELDAAVDDLLTMPKIILGADDIRDKMVSGEAIIAAEFAGDAMMMMEEDEDLAFVIPKEGSNVWLDSMVITKNSARKDAAHKFIDFMNQPENAFRNQQEIGYSTPNSGAYEMYSDEEKADHVLNPTEEELARCTFFNDLGSATSMYSDAWDRYKGSIK